jgi:hypothetical protein
LSVMTDEIVTALRWQQGTCTELGSDFYVSVLGIVIEDVESSGVCRQAFLGEWAGDLVKLAVPLRFLGAVNQLVLRGSAPDLATVWPSESTADRDMLKGALIDTVSTHLATVRASMQMPVQTNEVARSGVLAGGFITFATQVGLPLRLLELGASAGLNLVWDRYHYDDRGTHWGDPGSAVRLSGPYDGAPSPLVGNVEIVDRHGCDVRVLDLRDADDMVTLRSYIWPDQPERLQRLDQAIAIASGAAISVDESSAGSWIAGMLAQPQPGVATIVYHSIVLPYLSVDERDRVESAIARAGADATPEAPVGWLSFEMIGRSDERASLVLTTWPGGESRVLAKAGYHGAPVTWH